MQRVEDAPVVNPQLLTVNEYSRPGTKLEKVNGIVVHYTGNPGTTAMQNRNYFEGLKESKITKASSHYIIGLSGEIIQCIPLEEIAYASNERNADTISIECCIDNDAGRFNEKTYDSLVHLVAWLVGEYDLKIEDIIRHYDVTGKICPKYFVEHESAWEDFKLDVEKYIDENGVKK
ncbi:MAG: N-acetylmuramoyl-L-alanine amidase [Agathobacter sp.]|nr:N-acetylmuramoyl-L-alanine amidase [Agathobacter sp.]